MDYKITCVCGHQFLVSDTQVSGPVTCPQCHRRLSPVIEAPRVAVSASPADVSAVPSPASPALPGPTAAGEETKRCPFCGEVILAVARKCKHCGEFLDRGEPPPSSAAPFPPPSTPASNTAGAASPADPSAAVGDNPAIYSLSVSQWDNFWKYFILLFVTVILVGLLWFIPPLKTYKEVATPGVLVLAAFFAWFFYLSVRNTRIYVRYNRIDTEHGILSKELNSLELFRITDMELKQGLLERLLGIGTIKLITQDTLAPELTLYQIPHVREVFKYIQNQIPISAKQRGAPYLEK